MFCINSTQRRKEKVTGEELQVDKKMNKNVIFLCQCFVSIYVCVVHIHNVFLLIFFCRCQLSHDPTDRLDLLEIHDCVRNSN